ncbi:MAG TPA: CHC2 zinc finger domain-containing protein [Dehalococcoidia bacterium]|nr:CHC2 zinc finger domain-containing protein [Dehalococcoidia bacterium]
MFDVTALRRDNPIAAVMEKAGVELRPAGGRLIARCPLHADSEPSLVVYPQTESYFCYGCGAGGDVIDFICRIRRVGFKEAAAILGGSPAPAGNPPASCSREQEVAALTSEEMEAVEVTVRCCEAALWRSPAALDYLASRGIDHATAGRCRLGFGTTRLPDELRKAGVTSAVAQELGLLRAGRNAFAGRLIISNLIGGSANWITGRLLSGCSPRYLNLRLPSPLLGLEQVRGREVVLTEGPFDWLTLIQWGYPAAALVGTHASKDAMKALSRFERVYLALDNDDAGRRATEKLRHALGARSVTVRLPDFAKDVNALATRREGEAVFRRCISTASEEGTRWAGPVSWAA